MKLGGCIESGYFLPLVPAPHSPGPAQSPCRQPPAAALPPPAQALPPPDRLQAGPAAPPVGFGHGRSCISGRRTIKMETLISLEHLLTPGWSRSGLETVVRERHCQRLSASLRPLPPTPYWRLDMSIQRKYVHPHGRAEQGRGPRSSGWCKCERPLPSW